MERFLFFSFMAALALAPLPYGGNVPWAWSAMALWLGALLLCWGLAAIANPGLITVRSRHSRPLALAFLLLLAWYLAQNTRLMPAGFWHPLWGRAEAALGADLSGAIGLTPDAGLTTVLRYLTYAGSFWLALHLGRRSGRAQQFLWVLIVAELAYAAYGLTAHLDGSRSILGEAKWVYWESLTSTFVNRNSYAAFAGMGLIMVGSLLAVKLHEAFPKTRSIGWRMKLVRFMDGFGFQNWLLLGAALILATALLLTGSRGGFAAVIVGLGALFALLAWSKIISRGVVIALALLLLPLLFLIVDLSGDLLAERLDDLLASEQIDNLGSRADLANLALKVIAEQPLAGTGLGSFASIYLAERGDDFGASVFLNSQAHNTFLEVAMESGLPAALLLYALLGYLFYRLLRGQRLRPSATIMAAAAVSVQLGFHSLFDFPLQIPAVATIYFALLGFGIAQSLPRND